MSKKSVVPQLPEISLQNGETLQKIKYPCGCEVVGKAPLPKTCPTHNEAQAAKEFLVAVVLDESGSMDSCRAETIKGYNEYLHGLRTDGNPYLVTLTKFDSHAGDPTCRVDYANLAVAQVPDLTLETYVPRGGTPLYDAIGGTIKAIEPQAHGKAVLVIILTDGQENASKEYSAEMIKALIKEKEALGNWTFAYLGANQNAWEVGQQFGMHRGNVASYATAHVGSVMNNMYRATSVRYAGASAGIMRSASLMSDAGISDVNKHSAATDLGKLGGKARQSGLTPVQRKQLARAAAAVRWGNKKPGA